MEFSVNPFESSKEKVLKDMAFFKNAYRRDLPDMLEVERSILVTQCWPPLTPAQVLNKTGYHASTYVADCEDFDGYGYEGSIEYMVLPKQLVFAMNPETAARGDCKEFVDRWLHDNGGTHVQWANPVSLEGLMYAWAAPMKLFTELRGHTVQVWVPF